jgi:hypothetical protein
MLIAQSTIKPLHSYLFPHLLSTTGAHPCYKQCCSEGGSYSEVSWRCWWVLGVRNPQSIACDVWSLRFQDKRKSLIIFLFLTWYCFCINLFVTICMKLDPGIYIVMHLVFFGKTGVTSTQWRLLDPHLGRQMCSSCSWCDGIKFKNCFSVFTRNWKVPGCKLLQHLLPPSLINGRP